MTSERDNFKAGLFVVFGVVCALGAIWMLVDLNRLFEKTQLVTVRYGLSDGLQGLKEGASVTVGDQPVGEVVAITDDLDAANQRVTGKLIQFQIPRKYRLYANASIVLSVPAIGTGTKLNIRSVGNLGMYKPGDVLEGDLAGTALTRSLVQDMGIEDLQRQQLKSIIANVESITKTLKADLPTISQKVQVVLDDLRPLAAQAKDAVANASAAISDAKAIVADARTHTGEWFARIDAITAKADESLTFVRNLLKDEDPVLRDSLANVHAATEDVRAVTGRVKGETMDKIADAIDVARQSLENVKTSTQEIKALVAGQRPVIERALANAQLTTDQLKLAAIEVRRSPWRLLYRPTDKELDSDNLYDAARSFAQAAGALEAAAGSVRAVSQMGAQQGKGQDAQLQSMLKHLESLYSEYEKAEKRFWNALDKQSPAP